MRQYTPAEKAAIRKNPIWVKYSGSVPEELRHLVYPDEAKPEESAETKTLREQLKASVALETKKARKKAAETEDVTPASEEPAETADDGDSN